MTAKEWPSVLFVDQTGDLGGAEFALYDIAIRWEGRCRVVVFEDGPFPERLRQAGIDVKVLNSGLSSIRRESGLSTAARSARELGSTLRSVARQLDEFDLLYTNTQKASALGALVSTARRKPMVAHLHDLLIDDHFSAFSQHVARLGLRRATHIICSSRCIQDALGDHFAASSRSSVVYYGFELPEPRSEQEMRSELGIASGRCLMGIFSRPSPWKGQEVVLDALSRLSDVDVLIVGDAFFGREAFAEGLRSQVSELKIADRVHFLGFRNDVADLMAACDLTIHASTSPEPFGRVVVESMLVGTPVIAADAGGPREIIEPGRNGWLCEPEDSVSLAAAVSSALGDPTTLCVVAQNAKQTAESKYQMSRYVDEVRKVCVKSIEEHGRG